MARANRLFLPGSLWHVSHRCHQRAFLLKFAKDKQTGSHLLFEAKKRDGLTGLNDTMTSHPIHLLVHDSKGDMIQKIIWSERIPHCPTPFHTKRFQGKEG